MEVIDRFDVSKFGYDLMINWIIALSMSIIAGFLSAALVFTFPPLRYLILSLGRFKQLGKGMVFIALVIIPCVTIGVSLWLDHLVENLLLLWIISLFGINFFLFLGIAVIDGKWFWHELVNSSTRDEIIGERFDFCYTLADFHFIKEQVDRYFDSEKDTPENILSKIFRSYRVLNFTDYRKFILVTHAAKNSLSSDDEFWRFYKSWQIDPDDYYGLKMFACNQNTGQYMSGNLIEQFNPKMKNQKWEPRVL